MRQSGDCDHLSTHSLLFWLFEHHDQLALRVATANLGVTERKDGLRHCFEILRPGADDQTDDFNFVGFIGTLRGGGVPLPANEITTRRRHSRPHRDWGSWTTPGARAAFGGGPGGPAII